MAKSLLLLLCCAFLFQTLWAQAPRPDTVFPQKLQLKKADLGWAGHPAYFTKKMSDPEADSVRSLMYVGPARRDSFQLQLPVMKNNKLDLQIKAGKREPLFRRQ
jgi:hypothetical protein